MKAFVQCLLAAAIAVVALLPLAAAPDAPRVLLISIDGLMPSAYIDPALAARTPNLRRLAQEGVWADGVVGVTPTVTYPSHTTLITGVEPARHGIYDNRILDPENRSNGAWYWYARAIQVQTLPGAVRGRGLTAAGVTWPVSIGMDLDFNAPEYIGHVAPPGRRAAPARPQHAANALRCRGAGPRHAVRVAADRSRSHGPHQLHPAHLRAEPDDAAPDRARLGAAHLRAGIAGGARGDGADGPLRRRAGGGGAQGAGRREDDRRRSSAITGSCR